MKSPPQVVQPVQCVLERLSPEIKSPTPVASEPTDDSALQSPILNDNGIEQGKDCVGLNYRESYLVECLKQE